MTATKVIEEALRAYAPPPPPPEPLLDPLPPGLARRGRFLVLTGGPPVSMGQTLASIEADRNARGTVCDCEECEAARAGR